MDITFAARVNRIKPSATLSINAKINALKAEGKKIINLSVGEPDFDTPDHIKRAAIEALECGFTKYTATAGMIELRKAICEKFQNENDLHYTPKQILVSVGAKQSLFNLTQVLLEEGDEVIIPVPAWASYMEMVLMTGAKPILIETKFENHFKLTPEELSKAITSKTKLLMLNSPSNPSGIVYSKEDWQVLGDVLKKHPNIFIVSDDIYEKIIWNHMPFTNILNACPELYERTIIVNGVSKAYSMTGWRIGYAAGNQKIIEQMEKVQSQCTSGATSIAQAAALDAIVSEQSCVTEMVKAFKDRHDFVYTQLKNMPGIKVLPADGAFYLFPDVTGAIQKLHLKNDLEFTEKLLDAGVSVIPGSMFGTEGYIRISIANDMAALKEAMEIMSKLLS